MRLLVSSLLVAGALVVTGCQLVTDTAGLSDGDADPAPLVDASVRAPDASVPADAGRSTDAAVADAAHQAFDASDARVESMDARAADTGPVVPPAIGEDGGTLPGPPSSKCSVDSTTATTIVIVNQSATTIEVWWVDYSCIEHDYGNVDPGSSVVLGTYVTHPWRIRQDGTHALLRDVAPNTDANPRTVTYP